MLEGAEVLWEEHLDYEQLMEIRLVEGEIPFQLELQNNATPADVYIFDMEAAGYCRVTPTQVARADGRVIDVLELGEALVAYWDPALGQSGRQGDWSSCVVVGRDRAGYCYVLDAYLAQDDPPDRGTHNFHADFIANVLHA